MYFLLYKTFKKMCLHAWKFPKKSKIIIVTFLAFRLNELYFNRIFALLISTKSQIPKHEEMFKNVQNMTFFIDIKKWHFSGNFRGRPIFFIFKEKCVFSYCKLFWHVQRHRFNQILILKNSIHFDHFRFLSSKFEPLQKANDKENFV